jgi:hypothetical protein
MESADELRRKIKKTPPGVLVGDLIARGEVEIGFQQVSELLPIKGIDFIWPLPPDVQQITARPANPRKDFPARPRRWSIPDPPAAAGDKEQGDGAGLMLEAAMK